MDWLGAPVPRASAAILAIAAAVIVIGCVGGCGGASRRTEPARNIVTTTHGPVLIDPSVLRACRQLARHATVAVLCPTWLPAVRGRDGAFKALDVAPYGLPNQGGCSYLISVNTVGPAEPAVRSDADPFHMLIGGQCARSPSLRPVASGRQCRAA